MDGSDRSRLDPSLPSVGEGVLLVDDVAVRVEVHREADGSMWGRGVDHPGLRVTGTCEKDFVRNLEREARRLLPELQLDRRTAVFAALEDWGLLCGAFVAVALLVLARVLDWPLVVTYIGVHLFALVAGGRLGLWFTRRNERQG